MSSYLPQSKQKGVNYARKSRGWDASIYIAGKRYHLGYFQTEQEAIKVRLQAQAGKRRFLGPPWKERKRRFNPFQLIGDERFWKNKQDITATYQRITKSGARKKVIANA